MKWHGVNNASPASNHLLLSPCFFFFFKINLFIYFIYFWLRWVFVAARGLSLVAASGGYSSLRCARFSLRWLLLLWSMGSRCAGFSSCGSRASVLWHTGLVAPRHVGSSWTRARTRVPCIGGRILNHCSTKEAPSLFILWKPAEELTSELQKVNLTQASRGQALV